jgi:hypothetical protein
MSKAKIIIYRKPNASNKFLGSLYYVKPRGNQEESEI